MLAKKREISPAVALVTLLGILVVLLTACGDSTNTPAAASYYDSGTTAATSATTAAMTTASSGNPSNASGGKAASVTPQAETPQPERMVIRNATLTLQVSNLEQALTQLRSVATENGGLVFQENSQEGTATIVLQIPSQNYEKAITHIRQTSLKVVKEESSAQDVTEEYVDTRSQMVNLQRTEESLQKLLDKAQNLNDILTLQKELTNVRGEIEKRQGRLNFLDKRSAYSTITINLSLPPAPVAPTPVPAVIEPAQTWQPDKTAGDAWGASIKLLSIGGTALISLLVFSWWFLPFLVVGLLWWWRRRRRLAALRSESRYAEEQKVISTR